MGCRGDQLAHFQRIDTRWGDCLGTASRAFYQESSFYERFDRCRAAHQQLYDLLRESSPWLLSSRPRSMSTLSSPQIKEAQVLSSMGNPGNFPVIAARISRACASEAPGTIYDRSNPFAT